MPSAGVSTILAYIIELLGHDAPQVRRALRRIDDGSFARLGRDGREALIDKIWSNCWPAMVARGCAMLDAS